MSRVRLAGEGVPIPISALPDPNLDSNFPPQAFLYTESGQFDKTDFQNLGYTHFEVICIGAAGGRGGDGRLQFVFDRTSLYRQTLPVEFEDDYVASVRAIYPTSQGYGDPIRVMSYDFRVPVTNSDPTTLGTTFIDFATWALNYHGASDGPPNYPHAGTVTRDTYSNARYASLESYTRGGGGGGGGLHMGAGLLADLPTLTPVIVGLVGADGADGHMESSGVITPLPEAMQPPYDPSNPYHAWLVQYPTPRNSFAPPQPGGDGGGSSFGGNICQASGGKGGDPALKWPGGVKTYSGVGNAGGSGGRIDPGGGAAGSTASGIPGSDGTWDGVVGKGGGGGIGGSTAIGSPYNIPARTASHGGRGSYSFADPSVYGPRQQRSGQLPGGGGGALLIPGQYYGSKAPGSNPNGAVYLRLTKIG